MDISFVTVFYLSLLLPAYLWYIIRERNFVPKRRNTELIGVKPLLVIQPKEKEDFILEEKKDSRDIAQHFLNSKVGLK